VVRVDTGPEDGLEPVVETLDPVPALTSTLVELARQTAGETVSAWGEVVFRALPPGAR
jgi:primosomal protein N'